MEGFSVKFVLLIFLNVMGELGRTLLKDTIQFQFLSLKKVKRQRLKILHLYARTVTKCYIEKGRGITNAFIFIFISTILLSFTSVLAFYFTFPTSLNRKSATCIVVVCILFSILIYSESSTNVFQRSIRQVVLFLWFF